MNTPGDPVIRHLIAALSLISATLCLCVVFAGFSGVNPVVEITDPFWFGALFRISPRPVFRVAGIFLCAAALTPLFISRRLAALLRSPVVFALLFSIPFIYIDFTIHRGDSADWVTFIEGRWFTSAPGATLVHHLFFVAGRCLLNKGPEFAIQWSSRASGLISLMAIALISNILFGDDRQRMLFRLVMYLAGYTLLFCGYMENTPPMIPCELFFVYFTIRYLSTEAPRQLVHASLCLSLASLMHGSACFVFPALLFVIGVRHWGQWRKALTIGFIALGTYLLPIVHLLMWIFIFDREGIIGDIWGNISHGGKLYLSLFLFTPYEPYTMFSPQHLRDILNIVAMGAGCNAIIALPFLCLVLTHIRRGIHPLLLGYFAGRAVLLIFFHPNLGAVDDWDLTVPCTIPMVLISAYAATRAADKAGARLAVAPLLLANAVTTGIFFLYLNHV